MADHGARYWTTAFNPVVGCSPAGPGCEHCWAARMASRFACQGQPYEGLAVGGRWTGKARLRPEVLEQPLRWRRPRTAFIDMGDLFHPDVPDEFIAATFGVMLATQQHRYLVLTKRTARMREWFHRLQNICTSTNRTPQHACLCAASRVLGDDAWRQRIAGPVPVMHWPPVNVWPGTSCENQAMLDLRLPDLQATPAAQRWLSLEPLLGPIDLSGRLDTISWVVVGGESGPGARPCDAGWIRDIVRQCKDAWTPVFVKQLGSLALQRLPDAHETGPAVLELDREWPAGTRFGNPTCWPELNGRVALLRDRSGADMAEWPAGLRVRERP